MGIRGSKWLPTADAEIRPIIRATQLDPEDV